MNLGKPKEGKIMTWGIWEIHLHGRGDRRSGAWKGRERHHRLGEEMGWHEESTEVKSPA